MPLKQYKLGPLVFRFWLGPPPPPLRMSTQVIDHPGTDYQAVRLMGLKSQQISRRSIVDVADADAGYTAFESYAAVITGAPQQVIWADEDLDAKGWRAKITDVRLIDLTQRVLICEPITPGNSWDLVAEWDMVMQPYSP